MEMPRGKNCQEVPMKRSALACLQSRTWDKDTDPGLITYSCVDLRKQELGRRESKAEEESQERGICWSGFHCEHLTGTL